MDIPFPRTLGIRGKLSARWADISVLPLIIISSILPLLWYARNWLVNPDASWYLLQGWNLISGEGYTVYGDRPAPLRGPVLPAVLALLMLPFGRDVYTLVWTMRLIALLNPLLIYLIVRRIAGPKPGIVAAALVAFFGYTAMLPHAFTVDAMLLMVYLLSVLALMLGVHTNNAGLSLLSGMLLGAAILTKETAITALPLGLVASLLFAWSVRGLLLHYAGVLLVCVPWWIWVWVATGNIYLVGAGQIKLLGRSRVELIGVAVAAAVLVVAALVGLYRLGFPRRLLRNDRARRRTAWFIACGWALGLSGVALSGNLKPLRASQSIGEYFATAILSDTPAWFLLPLAAGYMVWKTVRGHRGWAFYLALCVLWIPVPILVAVLRYQVRQWIVPQTLLYGALAGLTVEVIGAVASRTDWKALYRRREAWLAAIVITGLLASTVAQAASLVTERNRRDAYPYNQANPAVFKMHDWIDHNVPAGKGIIVTEYYANQLAFMDGGEHNWTRLKIGGRPRASLFAPPACPLGRKGKPICERKDLVLIWLQMKGGCNATSLSLTGVLPQSRRTGSDYLLLTHQSGIPSVLAWAPTLADTGAFEIASEEYLRRGGGNIEESRGLVLLKRTGKDPAPAPTLMNEESFKDLISCAKAARGKDYTTAIRAAFPDGINLIGPKSVATKKELSGIYGTAE